MAKSRSNTHFTNPCRIGSQQPAESSFEQKVHSLRLTAEQYAAPPELKAWVRRNKRYRYVPPDLLKIFGFATGTEV